MTELTTPNAKQLTEKKNLRLYVHDAVEIECAVETLKRLEETLRSKINQQYQSYGRTKSNTESAQKAALEKLEEQKQIAEKKRVAFVDAKEKRDNPPQFKVSLLHVFKEHAWLLPAYIILSILLSLGLAYVLDTVRFSSMVNISEKILAVLVLVFCASISLFIFCLIFARIIKSEKLKKQETAKKTIDALQTEYDSAYKDLELQYELVKCANRELEDTNASVLQLEQLQKETENKIAAWEMQINFIEERKKELQKKLADFYSIGLIPPDYRHADCVLMLDHFFRNDLVNTMQEAVRYYNHKLEIKEIVRGLDNIRTAVNQLNATMQSVYMQLREIDNNMYSMHRDLINTLDRQAYQNEETTKELLEESRAGRYATEQLNKTNEKILWYKQQEYYKNNQ